MSNDIGISFEHQCAAVLKSKGFKNVVVTKASGDQGVDIIAEYDNEKYAIQCKCYSKPVGNKAVQEVFSGMAYYKCDRSIVLTNSTFTKSATELAKRIGVDLWQIDIANEYNRLQTKEYEDRYFKELRKTFWDGRTNSIETLISIFILIVLVIFLMLQLSAGGTFKFLLLYLFVWFVLCTTRLYIPLLAIIRLFIEIALRFCLFVKTLIKSNIEKH